MIFSSGKQSSGQQVEFSNTDCFCLFSCSDSIEIPHEIFWPSILTSLKMKKNVAILEVPVDFEPLFSSQRWLVSEGYLWLAPRAFSTIFEAIYVKKLNYPDLRQFLLTFK